MNFLSVLYQLEHILLIVKLYHRLLTQLWATTRLYPSDTEPTTFSVSTLGRLDVSVYTLPLPYNKYHHVLKHNMTFLPTQSWLSRWRRRCWCEFDARLICKSAFCFYSLWVKWCCDALHLGCIIVWASLWGQVYDCTKTYPLFCCASLTRWRCTFRQEC